MLYMILLEKFQPKMSLQSLKPVQLLRAPPPDPLINYLPGFPVSPDRRV